MNALAELQTPALLLERAKLDANWRRMADHIAALGPSLRLHVKTAKSLEAVRRLHGAHPGPICVSTLREAEVFGSHGYRDVLYTVALAPNKVGRAAALASSGMRLKVAVDNVELARALAGAPLDVLIEIDSDGHRAGLRPDDARLLEVARALAGGGATVAGVMTHAGASYNCASTEAIRAMAAQERDAAVHAARRLRDAGFAAPVVSVGSTPTATFADDLAGVTEVRAGVFVFFDLVMAGIDVCDTGDIALSVLATVIGHQQDKGWALIDAGWMALSRDRGTARQRVDQGYGLVCDAAGMPIDGLIVVDANQEHGIVAHRSGDPGKLPEIPVGTLLRILPNHACATAAQHERYAVLDESGRIAAAWERFSGW
jgi:D-serine deaminase-like pyridoxal phosphate-dependent protein